MGALKAYDINEYIKAARRMVKRQTRRMRRRELKALVDEQVGQDEQVVWVMDDFGSAGFKRARCMDKADFEEEQRLEELDKLANERQKRLFDDLLFNDYLDGDLDESDFDLCECSMCSPYRAFDDSDYDWMFDDE